MQNCGRYPDLCPDGRSVPSDLHAASPSYPLSQDDNWTRMTHFIWGVLDAFPDARKALQDALRQELRNHEQNGNKTNPSP